MVTKIFLNYNEKEKLFRGKKMDELLTGREMEKLVIIEQVSKKLLRQRLAGMMLNLSERQVRRILKRYRIEGKEGIRRKSITRGPRKYDEERKRTIMLKVEEKYRDFGPTFTAEKLQEIDGISINKETLRQWMIETGMRKQQKRKDKKIHQSRERRPRFGELVQIDGSHHDWFEGRRDKCCLLVFIDEATSRLLWLSFEEGESSHGYMKGVRSHILNQGKPLAYYSDRHSIFITTRKNDSSYDPTQLHNSLKELKIELICANSPQAKGRVERANCILQDRLIKELRLRNISTLEEANEYVKEFMEVHNEKFSKAANNKEDAHSSYTESEETLKRVLSHRSQRTLSKALEFSYQGDLYQVQNLGKGYRYRKAKIDIYEHEDGTIEACYKQEKLEIKQLSTNKKPMMVGDKREIDRLLAQKLRTEQSSIALT